MKVIVGSLPAQSQQSQKFSKENSLTSPRAHENKRPGEEIRGLFRRKTSGSAVQDIEWENLQIEELVAMATTNSLMGELGIYRFSGALSGNRSDEFLDITKELSLSAHQFIFTEEKLLKKVIDTLQKMGAEVVLYPAKDTGVKKAEAFNIFSLTYAFAARDRKKLWILYREALSRGVVPEAIAGVLHWKVRDLLVKSESSGFSKQELRSMSGELVSLYHDSHRGVGELPALLERYILQL